MATLQELTDRVKTAVGDDSGLGKSLKFNLKGDGVVYINTGTWTEAPPCPFLVVDGSDVRLEFWPLASIVLRPEPEETPAPAVDPLPPMLPAMG